MALDEKAAERPDIILGLLTSVERHGSPTQRHLAAELGIALGLVNAYLKRCVKKGLVKVKDAPARRYAYYLTPKGFSEKSRLTVEYLSISFSFFRKARQDCGEVFESANKLGWKRVVLAGASDLAEVCVLSALEYEIKVVAIVDDRLRDSTVAGNTVYKSYTDVPGFDGIVVSDLEQPSKAFAAAVEIVGSARVLAPALLNLGTIETLSHPDKTATTAQSTNGNTRRVSSRRRSA